MSRFSGRAGRGAMRHLREIKREEAEARQQKFEENLVMEAVGRQMAEDDNKELQEKLADYEGVRAGAVAELAEEL